MAAPNPPNPSGKLEQQINIDAVLKLTDAQKQKIRKITTERGKQILTVLTPSQRDRFTTAVKKGQPAVPVLQSLDLNLDRKKKIFNILKANGDEIKAVLTPEQIKKVQELQRKPKPKP